MDDLISRKSLYDKMSEAEDLARQRVIDTRSSFPNGSLNPAYIRYMAQLSERTRFKEMIYEEGVTPEKAVETFGNISKIVQIIVEEMRKMIRKAGEEWGT